MAKDTMMYLRPLKSGRRSKVAEDAEVRAVVDELDGKGLTLDEIHRDVAVRFAQERVPSRSAIHRYMVNRRKNHQQINKDRAEMCVFSKQLERARTAHRNGKLLVAIGYLEQAIADTKARLVE